MWYRYFLFLSILFWGGYLLRFEWSAASLILSKWSVTRYGKKIMFPIPKDRLKYFLRHFLSVNSHRWSTDTARCRSANRRPNWAPPAASSDRPRSPHDFSIITPSWFVRLSNLRIDRILAGLSPPRLALFNAFRLGGSTDISVWRLNYTLLDVRDAA